MPPNRWIGGPVDPWTIWVFFLKRCSGEARGGSLKNWNVREARGGSLKKICACGAGHLLHHYSPSHGRSLFRPPALGNVFIILGGFINQGGFWRDGGSWGLCWTPKSSSFEIYFLMKTIIFEKCPRGRNIFIILGGVVNRRSGLYLTPNT